MSAALVRQALEFVDQEENIGKRDRRGAGHRKGSSGQDRRPAFKRQNKKGEAKSLTNTTQETIKKLLALSRPASKKKIADKIVQRAIKGKPLIEKIEVKKDEGKSILFADEDSTVTPGKEEGEN